MGIECRIEALPNIRNAIWNELRRAVNDKHHAWRTPVLATMADGQPDARTVVLREVDADTRQLEIYSDSRASKIKQLAAQGSAKLVFWSKRLGWQVRCTVKCTVDCDAASTAQVWTRIAPSPAAADYMSPLAPGQRLDTDTESAPIGAAANYFAVIRAEVRQIDWLELDRRGHRRALFDENQETWLQP